MKAFIIASSILIVFIATAIAADLPTGEKTGFIEGHLVYPSDGVPSDMKIYAENISTGKTYVMPLSDLNDPNTFTDKTEYRIKVPVGNYYVYSMTNHVKGKEDYRAYYSEFVTCGLKANCTSHEPIKVSVRADKSANNIDPVDWYDSENRYRGKH